MSSRRIMPAMALFAVQLSLALSPGAWAVNIKDELQAATAKFRDLTATFVSTYTNKNELSKMGKSYARSYEFKEAKLFFKDPDKFKMEGKLGMIRMEYIIAGDIRVFRVPSLHISKKEDLSKKGGKKQTCIDVGMITDGIWKTFDVRLIGEDSGTYVIDIAPPEDPDFRQRIWVDCKDLYMCKREQYDRKGRLRARYLFKNHKRVDGVIWVAGKTEMYNRSGGLAGISELRDIKVNDGVADSEFR